MNTNEIKRKTRGYFSALKQVIIVYLFGSYANNSINKLSDIDIAVYVNQEMSENKRFGFRLDLISKVGCLLRTNKIDLVILNDLSLFLSSRVIHEGKILYCRDELIRIRFETNIMKRYFDRKYYYDRHKDLSLAAIAKDGLS